MELVIQVDEPLDHLHPFITKSGEQTEVLAMTLIAAEVRQRKTEISDSS